MDRTLAAASLLTLLLAAPVSAQDAATPADAPDRDSSEGPPARLDAATGGAPATGAASSASTGSDAATAQASTTTTTTTTDGAAALHAPRREHPATPDPAAEGGCTHQEAPVFDPSSPRLEIDVGGGYAAYFVTWRSISAIMDSGRHTDGLWHGPFFRGEVSFALGSLSISAVYTHVFTTLDGAPDASINMRPGGARTALEFQWLSFEIGLQCACHDSTYVWSFGVEGGYDLANGSMLFGLEHRSLFYVWEGLFLGFDFNIGVLIGFPFQDASMRAGPSGGGFEGSLFIGYAIG